jgi:hypothetical protein
MADTPTVGLLVTMEAKPGREHDVEQFLDSGLSLVNQNREPRYGSPCASAAPPTGSSTCFSTTPAAMRTSTGRSPRP